jgi:putative hemolysin
MGSCTQFPLSVHALVTALHIVLGEFVPKSIALQEPGRTSLWLSLPMEVFVHIFRPAI